MLCDTLLRILTLFLNYRCFIISEKCLASPNFLFGFQLPFLRIWRRNKRISSYTRTQLYLPETCNSSPLRHHLNGLDAKTGLSSRLAQLSRLSFGLDHSHDHHGPMCPRVGHWAQGRPLSSSSSVARRIGQRQSKKCHNEKSPYSHRHNEISAGLKQCKGET